MGGPAGARSPPRWTTKAAPGWWRGGGIRGCPAAPWSCGLWGSQERLGRAPPHPCAPSPCPPGAAGDSTPGGPAGDLSVLSLRQELMGRDLSCNKKAFRLVQRACSPSSGRQCAGWHHLAVDQRIPLRCGTGGNTTAGQYLCCSQLLPVFEKLFSIFRWGGIKETQTIL